MRHILQTGAPYMFYIHPWEIDPGQPRVAGLAATSRFRHYVNLGRSEERFRTLLSTFQWTSVRTVLDAWRREVASTAAPAHEPASLRP